MLRTQTYVVRVHVSDRPGRHLLRGIVEIVETRQLRTFRGVRALARIITASALRREPAGPKGARTGTQRTVGEKP